MTDPVNEFYWKITSVVDRNAAVTIARFDGLAVTGSSKRNPEDVHLPAVGEDLAYADMFEKLAVKLRKRAQGRVNTFENNRKQRRASAARKAGGECLGVLGDVPYPVSTPRGDWITPFPGRPYDACSVYSCSLPGGPDQLTSRSGKTDAVHLLLEDGRTMDVFPDGSTRTSPLPS